MMTDKNVLVTGGAGAIGTILVKKLSTSNNITVIDNFSSGRLGNLDDVNCEIVNADIRDCDKLDALFKRPFDVVIHLAAHFANQNSIDYPGSDMSVNINGTLNILSRCQRHKARVVYASSSCVYGGDMPPFSEDDKVHDLHTPYAVSKYSAELYARFYALHYGMEVVVLRFFNNFGPYDLPGPYRNVLPNFILRALRNQDLTITGNGEETRDFNYCENTVSAIIKAAGTPYSAMPESPVFNVGTGIETKMLELAEMVKRLTGSKSQIVIRGRRDWDRTSRRVADITKITRHLGYSPDVSLEEGLKKTIEWFSRQDWRRF